MIWMVLSLGLRSVLVPVAVAGNWRKTWTSVVVMAVPTTAPSMKAVQVAAGGMEAPVVGVARVKIRGPIILAIEGRRQQARTRAWTMNN
jgi:hypothetical protein